MTKTYDTKCPYCDQAIQIELEVNHNRTQYFKHDPCGQIVSYRVFKHHIKFGWHIDYQKIKDFKTIKEREKVE